MELSAAIEIEASDRRRRIDGAAGVLIGSGCPVCAATSWPPRAVCHRCGSPMDLDKTLPKEGALLSFTRVWIPRPGLEAPYTLGQIEILDSIFFAHVRGLDDGARVPMTVTLVVRDERDEAEPVSFWFEPAASPAR
jgi:hypothetical protein